ncbi:MAG: chemotaxis protein CheA, partial [Burkholderiaceae bacterium]
MNLLDDDGGLVAAALPAFVDEGQEQIASIEQLLLQLEDAPDDRDLLDALFRCAHTVKGSAGLFGLDAVVAFTHHVETLLDQLREGAFPLTPELSTLLLQCNDEIRHLIDECTGTPADPQGETRRAELIAQLQAAGAGDAPATPAPPAAAAHTDDRPADAGSLQPWQIRARFGIDTFRHGMDPLAILAYLGQLGELGEVRCELDAVPPLPQLDAENCHLAIEVALQTAAGRAAIEDAFAFVLDDTALEIRRNDVDPVAPPAATPVAPPTGPSVTASPAEPLPAVREAPPAVEGNRYIRVQADRLDAVINLLGELVIAGAGALLLARQSRQATLVEANEHIGRLVEEIRNGTLQLRMVPIGETFARFRRVVRDTAAELGKDVALHIV